MKLSAYDKMLHCKMLRDNMICQKWGKFIEFEDA